MRCAVADFKQLLPLAPEGEKQDAIAIAERGDGAAPGELMLDVFAPVGDGFDPAVGLFDHATGLSLIDENLEATFR